MRQPLGIRRRASAHAEVPQFVRDREPAPVGWCVALYHDHGVIAVGAPREPVELERCICQIDGDRNAAFG